MAKQGEQVKVSSLSPQELQTLSENLQSEIQALSSQHNMLRSGRERYLDSKRVLESLATYQEGDKMLVPLTSSLYVPGELGNPGTAIIEVGAGYYVRMSNQKGQDFMDRKMKNIQETMQNVEKAVMVKSRQLEAMQMTLRQKVMEAQAQQQQQQQQQQGGKK
eukprot:TRINITY_DN4644_c0_g1_i1.p1 TRINITY_DN4644_c0_g1~~TRINITY_DN4644_c0_g1_i1.p1  ORF type:complete len:186 (+),score=104.41 TRINITY_DN4644_c0_g1_i1:73-558(+)